MAKFINMPKMGNTVTAVIFGEWFVKEGDDFKVGDKLFSYETDKTTTEETAKEDGTVLKLITNPNDEVPVFDHVMIVGEKNDDISDLLKEITVHQAQAQPEAKVDDSEIFLSPVADTPLEKTSSPQVAVEQSKPVISQLPTDYPAGSISPRALQLLRKSGIPINAIHYGSGPNQRIISNDVVKAMNLQTLNTDFSSEKPLNELNVKINDILKISNSQGDEELIYSPMRIAIAKAMMQSQKQSAFTTLTMSVDANKLLDARKDIKKAMAKGGPNITINDLIIFGVSRVLPKYRKTINAHVQDTKAMTHGHANIAMAVDTSHGLIVPVIKEANLKSLPEISQEAKAAIKFVKNGDFKNVDLRSGTFTISNVGGVGIEVFTPVLNAGQAAILGVGTTVLKPRLNKQGLVEFYQAMILSLTIDHRLVDGADGARFLNDVKLILENIDLVK